MEEQLQRYVEMRQHIASFDKTFELVSHKESDPDDGPVMGDMLAKLSTLFVFDFEGALCLKGWDDLGQIVRKARICKDELMYKAMGDSLLRSQAPGKGKGLPGARESKMGFVNSRCSAVRYNARHHQPDFRARGLRQPEARKVCPLHVPGDSAPRRQLGVAGG